MVFYCEVDFFYSPSLDKAFLGALEVEHKVDPQILSPQTQYSHPHIGHSNVSPASPSTPLSAPWCTFHQTKSHASVDCRALKNIHTNKTLFAEVAQLDSPEPHDIVSL